MKKRNDSDASLHNFQILMNSNYSEAKLKNKDLDLKKPKNQIKNQKSFNYRDTSKLKDIK